MLSEPHIVYEGARMETLGSIFFTGIYIYISLRGLTAIFSSKIVFFERASLVKTISDPKGQQKISYSFFDFGLCCPQPVLFLKR